MKISTFRRRWYEFHSHHFSHAVRPCKPPVLPHGKSYRSAQENAVQSRTEVLCVGGKSSPSSVAPEHQRNENSVPFPACASEKIPKFIFFVPPLWTDARNPAPVNSTGCGISFLPFARVSRFATPFCTTPFQGVRQSYALKAGVGNHDPIQNAVACKSEQSKNFAAIRHNAHKPRRAALHFLWFFSERAGRTAQRAAQGFSEKANLGLGFVYLGYRFGTG